MDWDRVSDALNINVNVRPWRSGHVRQTGFSSSSPDAHSSTLSPLSQFQVHFHFFEWGSTHHIHAATLPHLRPHQASGTGLPPTSLKHNFVLSFYRLQPPPNGGPPCLWSTIDLDLTPSYHQEHICYSYYKMDIFLDIILFTSVESPDIVSKDTIKTSQTGYQNHWWIFPSTTLTVWFLSLPYH